MKKTLVSVVLLLILFSLASASTQLDKKLDLDTYEFLYKETQFNDGSGSFSTSFEFDYTNQTGGNKTYYVEMPKNSTILDAKMNVTGEITTVYKKNIITETTSGGLLEIDIENITSHPGNEIAVGTQTPEPNVFLAKGGNGENIWDFSTGHISVAGCYGYDLHPDPGKEISFVYGIGEGIGTVIVLNTSETEGVEKWNFSYGDEQGKCMGVGNLDDQGLGEVVYVSSGKEANRLFVLNGATGEIIRYINITDDEIYSVLIGNLSCFSGMQVIAGGMGEIHIYNKTLHEIHTITEDVCTVSSLAMGELLDDPGDEIVAGTNCGEVFVFNTSGSVPYKKWNITLPNLIKDVEIGNAVGGVYEGNEIVVGDQESIVYTLDNNGNTIWSYNAGLTGESWIESVDVGDVTDDEGNEVAAGGQTGWLYVFNFDYFPTNLTAHVGGDKFWNFFEEYGHEKIRDTKTINQTNFTNSLQSYLDSCTPDENGNCNVPLVFHSDWKGRLKISDLNITYNYDASLVISDQETNQWSRTKDINVNESVGNQSINISFLSNPANSLNITHIKVNSSSGRCDFNGSKGTVVSISGGKYCDIPDFTLTTSGSLPPTAKFWENGTMTSDRPVLMNVSSPWFTYQENNYRKRKNLTIWPTDPSTTFYNVTANVSIQEINGETFLKVYLVDGWWDITPNTSQSNCNGNNPTYTYKNPLDYDFYICKQDSNGDGTVDLFKWKQGETSTTNYITNYMVGGSTNLAPDLTQANVTPNSDIWDSNFNFTVNVTDQENNGVNVTLWVFENRTGWIEKEEKNTSGSGIAWFDIGSNKNWTGTNKYKFEYFDYNKTNQTQEFHSAENTSEYLGPIAQKRNVTITHVLGNYTDVNRTETQRLSVKLNDTHSGEVLGENVSCAFWITSGEGWDSRHPIETNSSGFCNYDFIPDGNYSVGEQKWKVGIYDDEFYDGANSTNFTVFVHGKLNISITRPGEWGSLFRNKTKYLEAKIIDQYNTRVQQSGYNCSFWLSNGTQDSWIQNTTTNGTGYCSYSWEPNCSLELGNFSIKTILEGNVSSFYTIENNEDQNNFKMKDELNITITNPESLSLYHKGKNITLNSTVNDTCLICQPENYHTNWSLLWYKKVKITLTETSDRDRINEPYVITGQYLKELGLDISQLEIGKTRVLYNGNESPVDVLPWDENRTSLNSSQTYLKNNSEIVFLVDIPGGTTKTYWLAWNETNHPTNISFIKNGGFESGSLDYWNYTSGNYTEKWQKTSIENKGYGVNEYSAHLLANDFLVFLNQSLGRSFSRVKMRYKAWGTYSDESYAKIITNNGTCDLGLSFTSRPEGSAPWTESLCNFTSAKNLSVVVYDYRQGSYTTEASHLLIDYLCVANETGACLHPQSGLSLEKEIEYKEDIENGDNIVYPFSIEDNVGKRRFFANVSGEFYKSDRAFVDALLYGWSYVNKTNVTSDYCVRQDGYSLCAQSSPLTILCLIKDGNISEPIRNYNVSFYNDTSLMGWNLTNENGIANFNFNSSNIASAYNVTCNITDSNSVYYNITPLNSGNYTYEVSSGNTTGSLSIEPLSLNTSDNITEENNYTFQVNFTLKNIGDGNMYSPILSAEKPEGIYASSPNIPSLGPDENSTGSFAIDVTNAAPTGITNLTWNITWTNGDSSTGFTTNSTQVDVKNNTVLQITQAQINSTLSAGFGKNNPEQVSNFTVEAFGNTQLRDINFTLVNTTRKDARNWITLDPPEISKINQTKNRTVLLNLSIPVNASAGIYSTNITATSQNSSDWILFNLTVNVPDWTRTPETMNKTIGVGALNGTISQITIQNNINNSITFNTSLTGNGTSYIHISENVFEVQNQTTKTIQVFHNRTTEQYQSGVHISNLTIQNMNDSSPLEMKTEILLNIVNLTVDITSPTTSEKVGPINSSDEIQIYANVTKPDEIITENVTFEAFVGGESCQNLTNHGYWTGGGWQLKCNAPEISNNPIYNNLQVKAVHEGVTTYGEQPNSVIYYDVAWPKFSLVDVDFVNQNQNIDSVPFNVEITDNTAMDKIWSIVTLPNKTNQTLYPYENSSNIYYFNFTNPNINGDYDITIYANDTGGTYGYGGHLNSTLGWFDVYIPNQVHGNLENPGGEKVSANFTFYRPGKNLQTLYKIKETSTESNKTYNWTLHKRKYDVKAEVFGQEVEFHNMDLNSTEVAEPFDFDYFSNYNKIQNKSELSKPDQTHVPILGLVVEKNRASEGGKLKIDADSAYNYVVNRYGWKITPANLRIYKCNNWNFTARECNSTYSSSDILSVEPDNKIFEFNVSNFSAFFVAEACFSDGSLVDCAAYGAEEEEAPANGGGGGGAVGEQVEPFIVDTNLGRTRINRGQSKEYWVTISNQLSREITTQLSLKGEIRDFISLPRNSLSIPGNSNRTLDIRASIPEDTPIGPYYGSLVIKGEDKKEKIDVTLDVKRPGEEFLSLDIDIIKNIIKPDENLKFEVEAKNLGTKKLESQMFYTIKKEDTKKIIKEEKENITVEKIVSYKKELQLNETDLEKGAYMLEVVAEFNGNRVIDSEMFEVTKPFLLTVVGNYLFFIALIVGLVVGIILLRKYYLTWKSQREKKQRYLFPVDYKKIPQKKKNSFWLGKIADTKKKAWFNPKDLTTHILVAGATGAGKSVSASIFVEEALEQKIPVIVFDPTAQFTGFMKPCKDKNVLRYYKRFGLDQSDKKSYKGVVKEINDPYIDIDFKKYMNPGEVTVFSLNKIDPENFDTAVRNIIDSMFEVDWEESTQLKMIVVFDEVHRLLEKYGGKGGYKALERACREFRKWGIGLIMCSQVLTDFKEAVAGNVLTDVQLNTKSMTDIEKVKDKYGRRYANRVTRQGVGVGMLQHPKFNDGKPYFVNFRPTYHNPHKITKEEMETYNEFARKIKKIEEEISKRKEAGEDMSDAEMEFKMAYDKLKLGKFRMAKLYITSLMKRLNIAEE